MRVAKFLVLRTVVVLVKHSPLRGRTRSERFATSSTAHPPQPSAKHENPNTRKREYAPRKKNSKRRTKARQDRASPPPRPSTASLHISHVPHIVEGGRH